MCEDKPQTPKVRDERIDSVKYWLIILVILGHVIEKQKFPDNDVCATTLLKWIYIFHMPLFIFISGYFTRKKNPINLISGIWKLLEPLIIIQLIVRIPEFIQKETFSFRELLTPWWLLWYMLSLIYWRLLIQIIPNRLLNMT